ncbi:GNA1162 family protein [Cupriavidus sp. AU9028]|uniref:DUF799 domain-containing protein n=1 Tax=Cupriavidus sp. AU9028 TaxID=2871157 RepID=UPI001C948E93|nr:GNA1162 family protein [Cupriavidus sp. AU9028]MBY4899163.1 DUF799 domain-containing protein [Cupriavidus sp. AU9028]
MVNLQFFRLPALLALAATLAACVPTPKRSDYTAFRAEHPRSVLVVPVVNRSVEVDAPDYFLSTISRPIAERGYYVFPVHLTKRIMEDEGLSDADLVHSNDPVVLANMFGADTVMYIRIDRWDSRYMVVQTTTTVELDYTLKSGKDGQTLWTHHEQLAYSPNNNSGGGLAGLIVAAVAAAIEKAKPNYIPLAQTANFNAVGRVGLGLPAGPYDPKFKADIAEF